MNTKKYAIWFDNGSGYLDADKLADEVNFDDYPYRQVATAGWDKNPNENTSHIIADSLKSDE